MTKRWLAIGAVFILGLVTGIIAVLASRSFAGAKRDVVTATTESTKGKPLYTCGMHPQVIQDHPGNCPICHMKLTPLKSDGDDAADQGAAAKGQKKILYWWDPMLGPSSISDKPGKSAMGMDMVPVYEAGQSGGPAVKIDPTLVQNMGVRTAEVTRGPLEKTVRTVGVLRAPEPGLHDVSLKINGWIDKLYADQEGMHVHRGEPLFNVYSPDLQVAEEELISAVKALRSLDVGASDPVRKESEGLVASAKRKLGLWDIAEEDVEAIDKASKAPKTVTFRSPADGEVVEKMVVQGSAVQAGMKLMRIEDHSKMWLDAQVYEEQIPVVSLGQTVEAAVDGVPGKTFNGRITFIHPHVDHMTRTVTVRITLDNVEMKLKPGMYATARIVTQPFADAIQVPREAVIDTGTRQIAFVVQPEGRFSPRMVRMGIVGDGDRVQILEGLAPGETVVTSGQFLLDVESRTTEAIQKLRKTSGATGADDMAGMKLQTPAPASAPTSQPTTSATQRQPLVVAHCPMKNADWLQQDETIANPYFGSAMLGCGEVNRKVAAPVERSDLIGLVQAYLNVERSLAADKLDVQTIGSLKAEADKLQGDQYAALRQGAGPLAESKDIKVARAAFRAVSAEVIRALEQSAK